MTNSDNLPEAEPQATPSEPPPRAAGKRKRFSTQFLLILSIYALVACGSAFSVFHYADPTIDYACAIAIAILATIWAINDARLRGKTFHPILRMLHLLLFPLSLVIYLVCTRGIRGLGMAVLHAIALTVIANVAFYCVFYAVYFSGYWNLFDPIYLDS